MKKFVALLVVALLVALIGYRINKKVETSAMVETRSQQVSVPTVTLEAAAEREISPKVVITGNVRAESEVDVNSRAAGRLTSVNVKIGDKVKKGDVLALVEQTVALQQLKQARGALEAARANAMNAQRNNQSAEALAKENSISDVQLVGSRAGLKAAEAGVMQAEAAFALAQENLDNTRITSPIEGRVTKENATEGAMVNPGAMSPAGPLFQIQSVGRLKLESSVDERELQFVKPGQPVRFEVDSYPGVSFNGKVYLISPSLDATTRRAAIEVTIDNTEGKLFPNMFAQGELLPSETRQALAIPQSALVAGKEKPMVYVVKDNVATQRIVKVGPTDGNYVAILEGLEAGEQVITSGQSRVSDGGSVQLASAAVGGTAEGATP